MAGAEPAFGGSQEQICGLGRGGTGNVSRRSSRGSKHGGK